MENWPIGLMIIRQWDKSCRSLTFKCKKKKSHGKNAFYCEILEESEKHKNKEKLPLILPLGRTAPSSAFPMLADKGFYAQNWDHTDALSYKVLLSRNNISVFPHVIKCSLNVLCIK